MFGPSLPLLLYILPLNQIFLYTPLYNIFLGPYGRRPPPPGLCLGPEAAYALDRPCLLQEENCSIAQLARTVKTNIRF